MQGRLDIGSVRSEPRPGFGVETGSDTYRMLGGVVAWDRLDDRDLPRAGAAVTLRGEHSLSTFEGVRDYWRVRADGRAAWSVGYGLILETSGLLGLSGGDVPEYDLHRLGGPRFLPGILARQRWRRQALGLAGSVGREVFGFRVSLEAGAGGVWDELDEISLGDLQWGLGLGVARPTPLGPVML